MRILTCLPADRIVDASRKETTVQDTLAMYRCVDSFFGPPFVDVEEECDVPVHHRYVHGGFEGTATRFSFT